MLSQNKGNDYYKMQPLEIGKSAALAKKIGRTDSGLVSDRSKIVR